MEGQEKEGLEGKEAIKRMEGWARNRKGGSERILITRGRIE